MVATLLIEAGRANRIVAVLASGGRLHCLHVAGGAVLVEVLKRGLLALCARQHEANTELGTLGLRVLVDHGSQD